MSKNTQWHLLSFTICFIQPLLNQHHINKLFGLRGNKVNIHGNKDLFELMPAGISRAMKTSAEEVTISIFSIFRYRHLKLLDFL